MSIPDDSLTTPPTELDADVAAQERELLAIYAELDQADRVLLWYAMLTLVDRQPTQDQVEE